MRSCWSWTVSLGEVHSIRLCRRWTWVTWIDVCGAIGASSTAPSIPMSGDSCGRSRSPVVGTGNPDRIGGGLEGARADGYDGAGGGVDCIRGGAWEGATGYDEGSGAGGGAL